MPRQSQQPLPRVSSSLGSGVEDANIPTTSPHRVVSRHPRGHSNPTKPHEETLSGALTKSYAVRTASGDERPRRGIFDSEAHPVPPYVHSQRNPAPRKSNEHTTQGPGERREATPSSKGVQSRPRTGLTPTSPARARPPGSRHPAWSAAPGRVSSSSVISAGSAVLFACLGWALSQPAPCRCSSSGWAAVTQCHASKASRPRGC